MSEPFQRHRQIGNQFFAVGSYERAAREFESAIELEPQDNFVRLKLARCWLHLDQHDKARRETEIALQNDPNDADAHYVGSYTTLKWKVALASIDTALGLSLENSGYHERRGYILTRQRRFAAAIESLSTALELSPDIASSHRQMAETLFDEAEAGNPFQPRNNLTRDKHEKVTYHVTRALELDPENARSHRVEARLKEFDLEPEASFEKWQEVLRLNPTDKYSQQQLRDAKSRAIMARWQEQLWRWTFRWVPWPLRLPLMWGLMGASFWWGIVLPEGKGFLSGNWLVFVVVWIGGALMTRLLLRDWLQFVPDRFLDSSLRALKKPPLR